MPDSQTITATPVAPNVTNVVNETKTAAPAQSTTSAAALPSTTSDEWESLISMHARAEQGDVPLPSNFKALKETPKQATAVQSEPQTPKSQSETPKPSDTAPSPPPAESIAEAIVNRGRKSTARVFDNLDENEQKLFRDMSNDAYNYLYPQYIKFKELSPKLTELEKLQQATKDYETKLAEASHAKFYDHPEAYILHEDYQKLASVGGYLNNVKSFLEQQQMLMEDGRPFQLLTYDEKGNPVPTDPIEKATGEHKVHLRRALEQTNGDLTEINNRIKSLGNDLKTRYTTREQKLQKVFERLIGKAKPHLDAGARKELEILEKEIGPDYARSANGQLVAYGFTLLQTLFNQLAEQQKTSVAKQADARVAATAGPTDTQIAVADQTKAPYFNTAEMKLLASQGLLG